LDTVSQMRLFMEPRSVAVVGATRQSGSDSFNIVQRLTGHGYKGRVYPVNPRASEILGIKAYPTIGDVPEKVDLAVIPVWERYAVPDLLKQCIDAGIKAVVVVTQGFADGDAEGRKLQDKMLAMARESGTRILGPNSLGVANAFTGLNTSFVPSDMIKVPIGVICQSGLFFQNLRSLNPLGKGIDVANGCDVHFCEALEYFEQDPDTKVILLHVEGLKDGKRFVQTASRVSRKKPIIALKTARTETGARAAQSHTGSLAGSVEVMRGALKQSGVVRASDVEEAEDLVKAFVRLPLMKGRRVGILSISGGAGVMQVDACSDYGLKLARLSPETQAGLREHLPAWMDTTNPLDLWPVGVHSGTSLSETAMACLSKVCPDPNVDGVAYTMGTVFLEEGLRVARSIRELMDTLDKPVCWWSGTGSRVVHEEELEKEGVVIFPSGERAIRALGKLNDYWQFLQESCKASRQSVMTHDR